MKYSLRVDLTRRRRDAATQRNAKFLTQSETVPSSPLPGNNGLIYTVFDILYDLGRCPTGVLVPVAKCGQQELAILPLGSLAIPYRSLTLIFFIVLAVRISFFLFPRFPQGGGKGAFCLKFVSKVATHLTTISQRLKNRRCYIGDAKEDKELVISLRLCTFAPLRLNSFAKWEIRLHSG